MVIQWLTRIFIVLPYFTWIKKTKIEYIGKKPCKFVNHVFVSNHRFLKDPPLLGYTTALPVSFVAKKELFKNPLLALFMYLTSTISVDRQAAESQTFKAAKLALSSKALGYAWNLGIFIEGTRSKDPKKLGRPNKGPLFIARLAKAPILPIGITYKDDGTILVKIGEAYEIDYKGDLEEQAWECLEKISHLCDYEMPERQKGR